MSLLVIVIIVPHLGSLNDADKNLNHLQYEAATINKQFLQLRKSLVLLASRRKTMTHPLYLLYEKVHFTLEQTMKAQRGSRGMLYSFLNLGARWVWVVNATPRPLYPQELTRKPLYRRLGETQGSSWWMCKISPLPEFDHRTVHPIAVAVPTELFRTRACYVHFCISRNYWIFWSHFCAFLQCNVPEFRDRLKAEGC